MYTNLDLTQEKLDKILPLLTAHNTKMVNQTSVALGLIKKDVSEFKELLAKSENAFSKNFELAQESVSKLTLHVEEFADIFSNELSPAEFQRHKAELGAIVRSLCDLIREEDLCLGLLAAADLTEIMNDVNLPANTRQEIENILGVAIEHRQEHTDQLTGVQQLGI